MQAYRDRGIPVAPGMKITYVVRDAKKYLVDPVWEASFIDAAYYRTLLDRAWAEIAFAVGVPGMKGREPVYGGLAEAAGGSGSQLRECRQPLAGKRQCEW